MSPAAAGAELRAEFGRLHERPRGAAPDRLAHQRLVDRLEVHRAHLRRLRLDLAGAAAWAAAGPG